LFKKFHALSSGYPGYNIHAVLVQENGKKEQNFGILPKKLFYLCISGTEPSKQSGGSSHIHALKDRIRSLRFAAVLQF
jgi:hypothetical protein